MAAVKMVLSPNVRGSGRTEITVDTLASFRCSRVNEGRVSEGRVSEGRVSEGVVYEGGGVDGKDMCAICRLTVRTEVGSMIRKHRIR